jgi:hypothetical protein
MTAVAQDDQQRLQKTERSKVIHLILTRICAASCAALVALRNGEQSKPKMDLARVLAAAQSTSSGSGVSCRIVSSLSAPNRPTKRLFQQPVQLLHRIQGQREQLHRRSRFARQFYFLQRR